VGAWRFHRPVAFGRIGSRRTCAIAVRPSGLTDTRVTGGHWPRGRGSETDQWPPATESGAYGVRPGGAVISGPAAVVPRQRNAFLIRSFPPDPAWGPREWREQGEG
jgi:hypothetical protein